MAQHFNRLLATVAMVTGFAGSAAAQTTTVSFDNLPPSADGGSYVPAGYGGINWLGGNWIYVTCSATFLCPNPDPDPYLFFPYQPHSLPNYVTVDFSSGPTMQFSFANGPQVFNGGWVSTFDNDYFGYVLHYNGSVVFTSVIATTGSIPTFVATGYTGPVDQVDIVASDIGDWALDDISYTTATPEPGSMLLLTTGLAGVGMFVRGRRRALTRNSEQ